jgi:hypothetical protein
MRRIRTCSVAGILASCLLLVCLASGRPIQTQTGDRGRDETPTDKTSEQGSPTIEMANVLFRYSPQLAVHILRLRGTIIPTAGHDVASFNDPASFKTAVEAAEIRVPASQLSALMNTQVARSPKAQVKNIRISVARNQLVIDGTMKKGLHVRFHTVADVALTSDNRVRIDVHQVKVVHLPVKGLMDALGLSMEDLISQNGLKGMSIDGDSFLIDPQTAFPPPEMEGRIKSVRVAGDGLLLIFGEGTPRLRSGEKGNYIALRGGRLAYGRDEMFDSDLMMTDTTPRDPLEFYLAQYWTQMVASQIRVTSNKGLRVRLLDYSKIKNRAHAD